MKYVKLFLLTVVVLCSFSNEKIPKIDLPAHTPKQTAQMSKLFRKVRYVPLETTDDCLLSYIHVQKIQDYILAWDYDSCCLFSGIKAMIRKLSFHFMRIFIIRMMGSSIFRVLKGFGLSTGWMVNMLVK